MLLLAVLTCCWVGDNSASNPDWLTGKQLKKTVQVEISGQWSEAPIRSTLLQISRSKGIPLFIDRRVDPGIAIDLIAKDINWEQLLTVVGEPHGFGFCRIDDIYYFGPVETAIRLPEQFEKLRTWTRKNRGQSEIDWTRPVSMRWRRLSQPDELMSTMAKEFNFEIHEGPLPMDVWPASELPNVSLLLKTALFSVGFEKWVLISKLGSKIKIVDFPYSETAKFSISNFNSPKAVAQQIEKQFLGVRVRPKVNSITISGAVPKLIPAISKAVGFQKVVAGKPEKVSDVVFTAQFKGKRGSVLATMAQQLQIRLDYQQELSQILSEHIEFNVQDETADQIIRKSLQGTDLGYQIEAAKLRVFRK